MNKPFNFKTAQFSVLEDIAIAAQTRGFTETRELIAGLLEHPKFMNKTYWVRGIHKTLKMIDSTFDYVPYPVFIADGNSKLPFYAFSTLPGVTCPGAGECLSFCYSPKAWRYPDAFFRQVQNTLLLRFNRRAVITATRQIPRNSTVRLYVDGDFDSESTLCFWTSIMDANRSLSFYGYSKSLQIIADYFRVNPCPSNYKLNLSSGHNATDNTVEQIKTLSVYRGDFVAVNIGRKVRSKDYGTKPVNDAIRSRFTGKVFPCPGKCGSCTSIGHACGSDKFNGKVIAIAVH